MIIIQNLNNYSVVAFYDPLISVICDCNMVQNGGSRPVQDDFKHDMMRVYCRIQSLRRHNFQHHGSKYSNNDDDDGNYRAIFYHH